MNYVQILFLYLQRLLLKKNEKKNKQNKYIMCMIQV